MNQEILWTVLPKSVSDDGSALLISVMVSPRLDTGGTDKKLSEFPDFATWPEQKLVFHVQFNNDPPVMVKPSPSDKALWGALFPPDDTLVRAFNSPDLSKRRIHSFPVENVMGFIKQVYSSVAINSPDTLPNIFDLVARGITRISTVDAEKPTTSGKEIWINRDDQLEEALLGLFTGEPPVTALPPQPASPPLDFFRAKYFHRFRGGDINNPVPLPKFDFHEALTLLGSHPFLLKKLGLIFDLEVPYSGQPASGTVQLYKAEHDFQCDDKLVKTHYELEIGKHRFITAPGPNAETAKGMLNLNANYSLQQVDIDGAALKAIDYANQLNMRAKGRLATLDSPTEDGLPALRSAGISVIRTGRAGRLSKHFESIKDLNDNINNQPDLWAEDVTRGYRVDIQDNSGTWRSLCLRDAQYLVGRYEGTPTIFTAEKEEGVITAAATQNTDPAEKDLFLHEALFHWDGWSMVSPRPGEVVQSDVLDHQEDLDANGYQHNPSETSLDIEITSKPVKSSLPRLRFGNTYRLRARAVDIAGNSLPPTSTDDSMASEPLSYRRFEPIEPPAITIVSDVPVEQLIGESSTRMAIRSYNITPAEDSDVSIEIAERLLLPPRTAVSVIEQYGHLDTPGGVDGSQATWERLAKMDDFEHGASVPDVLQPADIPAEVPYLWDPFVDAAVLRGVPGTSGGSLTEVSFDTGPDWWQAKPFRIAMIEGNGPPDWDATERVLTIALPKATIAKVRFSSKFKSVELDKMAIWKWIEDEAFDADQLNKLKQLTLDGLHWMLTPYRELTLVHAVQQPLANPSIDSLHPNKLAIGDTYASVFGDVSVHAASTGKLDLLATWSEPTGYGFERREVKDHVFDLPVPTQQDNTLPWGGRRHEFGDTKYRSVKYYTRATTRFRDYFENKLTIEELSRPQKEALPPDSDQYTLVRDVLNSARPLAPNIMYIIPTFGWQDDNDERGRFSRRQGGLRVYMEQPWFSSGDGELLGVVVLPIKGDGCSTANMNPPEGPAVKIDEEFKSLVTQWGRDPIWLSGATHQVPATEKFTRNVAIQYDLSLAEKPNALVAVAGHEVGFDEERQLFYCDIDIDAGDSYYPFVRLALVRYQPKSISTAELSRVVLTDYAQFAPDRIARVARDIKDASKLQVMVSGTGYRKNASYNCSSAIEARLERWLDDIGWVPVSMGPVTLQNVQALKTLSAWKGVVDLPEHGPDARFRVVIEEYESFVGDDPDAELSADLDEFGRGKERRLVYSDAVEIEHG